MQKDNFYHIIANFYPSLQSLTYNFVFDNRLVFLMLILYILITIKKHDYEL